MAARDDIRKHPGPEGTGEAGNWHDTIRYKHKDLGNRRKAKALLEKLMPEAERRSKEVSSLESTGSAHGENAFKHLHIDRVAGVHVYQGSRGGWFFDLAFKDLPEGVPNIIGQPVSSPLESREEAMEGAVLLLAVLVRNRDKEPAPQENAEAVFPFDDVVISMPSEMVRQLKQIPMPLPEFEYVHSRLDEIRKEFAGDGVLTTEIMGKLSQDDLMRVYAVVAMALCRGLARWPQHEEGVPKSKLN